MSSDETLTSLYPKKGEILEGKYEIQGVLGVGGMGAVLRAQHLLRKAPVALKFMSPAITGHPAVVERFLNEGVASSKIDSEHVVMVFDVSKLPSGVPYMVMEFLEGEDVSNLLRREGRQGPARAVHITLQILRGLQAAHRVKIVHRDMKPANCFLIRKDGERDFVKIVDFGISKIRQEEGGEGLDLTSAGAALGTPLYMSLEQARSPKDVDARTDLYSTAVILYELLAGVTPFIPKSGTLSELFTMLALEQPKPIQDLPDGLWGVVQKGLEKDRDFRFQSAEEMAEALLPFADERSEYVVSRLLRTHAQTPRTQRGRSIPPSGLTPSSIPPGVTRVSAQSTASTGSGTLLMSKAPPITQAAVPAAQGNTQPIMVAPSTSAAAATSPGSEKRGTPLVWAIAVVAVGAVAAAAWALGKVSSSQPEQPPPVALPSPTSQTVAQAGASAEHGATTTTLPAVPANITPETSNPSPSTSGSASATPSHPPATSTATVPRPPSSTKLHQIGRD
ncbi:MAG: protein kinase [Polyangiaceae bacterium]